MLMVYLHGLPPYEIPGLPPFFPEAHSELRQQTEVITEKMQGLSYLMARNPRTIVRIIANFILMMFLMEY